MKREQHNAWRKTSTRVQVAVGVTGVVMLAVPSPAWSLCPNCVGQTSMLTPTLEVLGLFLLVPFVLVFMVDGKRGPGTFLCVSNPELRAVVAKWAVKYLEDNPESILEQIQMTVLSQQSEFNRIWDVIIQEMKEQKIYLVT